MDGGITMTEFKVKGERIGYNDQEPTGEIPRGFCELTHSAGSGVVKQQIKAPSPRTPTVAQ